MLINVNAQCSIDWLSVTSKHGRGTLSPRSILGKFEEKHGRFGYKNLYCYESGVEHLWSPDREGTHIIYNGSTLKTIAPLYTIQGLVQFHVDMGHRVSRIDTAVDIFDSQVKPKEFAKEWSKGNVKTHAKAGLFISDPQGVNGDTFYVGSMKRRRKLFRVYDKGREQKVDRDWLRIEMQWGQGAAVNASKQIANSSDLGATIKGQIRGFVEFRHRLFQDIICAHSSLKVNHNIPVGVPARLKWLYESVLPALVKQEQETPGIAQLLADLVSEDIKRKKRDMRTV